MLKFWLLEEMSALCFFGSYRYKFGCWESRYSCQQSLPEKDLFFHNYHVSQVIGDKEVAVPTHLFKIVLCQGRKQSDGSTSTVESAIGGFMVPNEGISWSKDLRDFQLPVGEIERVSGLSFYPNLNRQKAVDLCQADTCNLIKVIKLVA